MPHAVKGCRNMEEFVALHQDQLKTSGINERYWPTLYEKLTNEVVDAGQHFMIQKVMMCDEDDDDVDEVEEDGTEVKPEDAGVNYKWKVVVTDEEGISVDDPQHVYIVDHAWTYRVEQCRGQLEKFPTLLDRMVALMDINPTNKNQDQLIQDVLNQMWRYNQTYNIGNAERGSEDSQPVWYIMDEFGSRIQHSEDPSFRMVPFCHIPTQTMFSILFPIRNVAQGDEVSRMYVEGWVTDRLTRKIRLLPWQPEDMTHLSFDQHVSDDMFIEVYPTILPSEPPAPVVLPRDRSVRVFIELDGLEELLTDLRFEVVEEKDQADVLWMREQVNDFKSFSEHHPGAIINMFPGENVINCKDFLALVARRSITSGKIMDPDTLETLPKWMPTTFDLRNELPQFVSYFQHRELRGLDNHWVCKPWNLGRSLDINFTNNLNYILRLPDTGPKIASKYVEDPVLYRLNSVGQLKFDVRFIFFVTSVDPLQLFVHKKFHVRLANKPFSLDQMDDIETHLTVLHLKNLPSYRITCEDFISDFEEQNPGQSWAQIEESIHDIIISVMKSAVSRPPPAGMAAFSQSRAVYGADIMLKWDSSEKGVIQPMLIEVNFCPNMLQFSTVHQDIVNDTFSTLIFGDIEGREIVQIA